MTKEEILIKARIDYPIGTVVNPVYLPKQTNTVSSDEFVWKEGVDGLGLCVKVKEKLSSDSNMIAIYNPKKGFSTIVSKPEQQFIIGKWYKVNYGITDWYLKYLNTTITNEIESSERIDGNRNYHSTYGLHNCIKSLKSIELVTDLTEIQQWLPDGHLDKIQTNIMEEKKYDFKAVLCKTQQEWDFVLSKYNPKNVNKNAFSKYENIYIIYELINSSDSSYLGCYGNDEDDTQVVSFQEWCNEFGHTPDFIKPIKEWSVGSYAVALKDYTNWNSTEKGDIYSIVSINNAINITKNSHTLLFSTRDTNFSWFPTLQEAEIFSKNLTMKEEKFKVGDWVLTSNNAHGWKSSHNNINNKILQITKINLKHREDEGGTYYFGREQTIGKEIVRKAELHEIPQNLTPKECNMQNIIKIGDEVEITDSYDTWKINLKGILLKDDYNSDIRYQIDTKSSYGIIWCKNVKLIKKAQTTNSIKKVLSSSPEAGTTNEIYIPKITKTKPKVDFTITNNTFAEIKFNHSVKPKKIVKPIIIEKFQLFI